MEQKFDTSNIEQLKKKELLDFIAGFENLSVDEVKILAEYIKVGFFLKGSLLFKEGDICNKCFFVLKGCLRQFFISDEGIEKTTQFYTEKQAAVFFTDYMQQTETNSNLACVEDTIAIIGEPGSEIEMYEKFPKLEQITRLMMEQSLGEIQDFLSQFITSSPKERYNNLLKTRPDLVQRVPQHQLASYLGITPESLSRIRKRMAVNKRLDNIPLFK
ncbi:MAG: Crp/Fnr family transcriptional regulator [Sphingobacteriia bacterium]|jgi:CRP-like cAMP-binding protein|nr:MAG: Crp/Fnr family transcriptional regulator [Sphingobacteriia bacterium]